MTIRSTLSRSRSFTQQQNLIRGALADRRRRGFSDNAAVSNERIARTSLRRALLSARAALNERDYYEFLEWFAGIYRLEFPTGIEEDVGFDYLNGVIKGPVLPLASEIAWLATRFSFSARAINSFRAAADQIEACVFAGRYGRALDRLSEISETHGETMWSVQLRIALEQKKGGLESQKAYFESIRGKYRRGILEYVAYQTSVRNEERTSWLRFSEIIKVANASSKDKEVADYLDYRLRNVWAASRSSIANVLRLEQSHSIIDQYETFVAFCQEVVRRNDLTDISPVILAACEGLAHIEDFRLRKIIGALKGDTANSSSTKNSSLASISNSEIAELAAKTRPSLSKVVDAWDVIYHEFAMGFRKRKKKRDARGVFGNLLTRFLHPSGDSASDAYELEKLCHNMHGLSIGRAALAMFRAFYPAEDQNEFTFTLIGLHSATSRIEDRLGLMPLLRDGNSQDQRLAPLADALAAYYETRPDDARTILIPVLNAGPRDIVNRLANFISLYCAYLLGDHKQIVVTISRLGADDPSQIAILPIVRMLNQLPNTVYKQMLDAVAPLNALNMLWKATESDKTASTLRLMTGTFLRRSDVGRPSSLIEQGNRFDISELTYFLREVCVPSVLDVSRLFKSSHEVLEERQAICGALNTLDPGRTADYSEEVLAITRRLKVDEGLRIVDQSRIHVDTDAVTRWAHKNLEEDFDRYNDLARAGIGATGNFDDALREIKEAIRHNRQGEFFTPQNEADTALIRLLRALREEFLNSSSYGLDYFLSKRIRHVSFVGLVRGPLEFAHLIATKPTATSDYGSNTYWTNRLATLSTYESRAVDEAIKSFSSKFDSAINRLKSEILHVRTEEHTKGIFDIPITMATLAIGRVILREDQTFDEFLRSVYTIFWAALQPSLVQARQIIDDELKMKIAHDIDELKAEIGAQAQQDPTFPELSAALAHASTEVQGALSEASSWFTRPEIREVTRHFELEEALDVAIESALKLHRAFTPNIRREVIGNVLIAAPDLIFITDAVLVAFSNVKEYSKLDNPEVSVTLQLKEDEEVLIVHIENTVSPRARSAQQDRRIDDIRALIESGVTDRRAKTEGGSGFIKLAAVVQQSARGRIEFGYVEETRFSLTVAYSIIMDLRERLDL
jgi:tetratricopeptide (TPR) repeat protein